LAFALAQSTVRFHPISYGVVKG